MVLTDEQLRDYARLGARARLLQLEQEIAAIKEAFPTTDNEPALPAQAGEPRATAAEQSARRRPRMTLEQRQEISQRMKAYWARRNSSKKVRGTR